jgi:hypothetical protein
MYTLSNQRLKYTVPGSSVVRFSNSKYYFGTCNNTFSFHYTKYSLLILHSFTEISLQNSVTVVRTFVTVKHQTNLTIN